MRKKRRDKITDKASTFHNRRCIFNSFLFRDGIRSDLIISGFKQFWEFFATFSHTHPEAIQLAVRHRWFAAAAIESLTVDTRRYVSCYS